MAGAGTLGAESDASGTRFTVWSSVAERVELCLFDDAGAEQDRLDLHPTGDGDWTLHVSGVGPGQRYGLRAHGPGDRAAGHACDPTKLLVDPAARQVAGDLTWAPDLLAPGVDSAPHVPRSVVAAPGSAARVATPRPWAEQVVYEAHVGHLTARHPAVAPHLRGTYGGLASPPMVEHLLRLGVTAVELLPVQAFVSEAALVAQGRRNVWGYNPLAWGAAHEGYAAQPGRARAELRDAVAALHEAGIEVWLDVVCNHTCEGPLGEGPVLSWRGLDNAAWYRLRSGPEGLVDDDVTGCGNAVDASSPVVRRLVADLLSRWVDEVGIDGFRFDLASTLARGRPDSPAAAADPGPGSLVAALADDPRLAGVRLAAEPWDVAPGGYALGRFPAPWREWSDRFRDDARDLWRGAHVGWSTVASRLTGSAELLRSARRPASSGINAVATHDGFTVADLVTYDEPVGGGHGQRSSGFGVDGPTGDSEVQARRRRAQRALLGTALLAQGVPMLAAGDELGRSQGGRADGYTLEPDAWGLDWDAADHDLTAWVSGAVALRAAHPALRRDRWIEPGDPAVRWLDPDGVDLRDGRWHDPAVLGLQVLLSEDDAAAPPVLQLLAPRADVTFALPPGRWQPALRADHLRPEPPDVAVSGPTLELPAGTLAVLVGAPPA